MKQFIKLVLEQLTAKDISRITKTNKEYIIFNVSVYNIGTVIRVKYTDKYRNPAEKRYWNGYDFILETEDCLNCLHELHPTIKYHRNPTPFEISFGEDAIHYLPVNVADVIKPNNTLKAWFVHTDGLRYYRDPAYCGFYGVDNEVYATLK